LEQGEARVLLALELAKVAEQAGRPGDARDALERALSVAPGHPELSQHLRRMYEAVGAHAELAQLLLQEAEQSSDDETRLRALVAAAGHLLEQEGETQNAIDVLERARTLAPHDLEVATLLARAYSSLGRRHDGLLILEQAANSQRGRRVKGLASIYVEMANIYQDADAAAEALHALTKAHEFDLKNPHLAMRLGRMAMVQDQEQVALRAFRSVTIMKPTEELPQVDVSRLKSEAHYHLALLAERQGDLRKAKILCSKALSENSSHEGASELLARFK
jgi:tetratricopeptide (TPR) repeat protein